MSRINICLIVVAIINGSCISAAIAEANEKRAIEWVSGFNGRDIGGAGIQRVTLLLKHENVVSRQFEIARVFAQGADSIRTVVTLLEPASLAGLAYRISEHSDGQREEVHLFLPAGARTVLELRHSRFFEGLLGADFSYDDLRWRLPEDGWTYTPLEGGAFAGRTARRVLGSLSHEDGDVAFPATVLWFDDKTGFLVRRDYYRKFSSYRDNAVPDKILELASSRCIDGVDTPLQMIMTSVDGNASELNLRSAIYHQTSIDWERLSIGALPGTAEWVASLPGLQPERAQSSNRRSIELCERP
jgi:hypothetical protein